MTDSTPDDDKTPETKDASTEENTDNESTVEHESAGADDAATVERKTVKRRPSPADDEDYDDEYDEYEDETEPVRRRPRPRRGRTSPQGRPRPSAAAAPNSATTAVLTVIATVVVIALIATSILFAVLWLNSRSDVKDMQAQQADNAQAEKVAGEYAAGASTFDYRDLGPWRTNLTKGVSPELKSKLETTVGAMNQLLQPLQWVSKSTVRDAVVNSHSGSIYKVSVYVDVEATNVQAASGRQVITVYNVTLDKDKDWEITDVGGSPADAATQAQGEQAPAPGAGAAPTETQEPQESAPPAAPAPGN